MVGMTAHECLLFCHCGVLVVHPLPGPGAVAASRSNVSIHGATEMTGNYAGFDGGNSGSIKK